MKKIVIIAVLVLLLSAAFSGCVAKAELDADKYEKNLKAGIKPLPAAEEKTPAPAKDDEDAEPAQDEDDNYDNIEASSFVFEWHGVTVRAAFGKDDGSAKNGNNTPEGKFVNVSLKCEEGKLTWDDISKGYMEFTLRDSQGNVYEAVSTGFTLQLGQQISLDKLEESDFIGLAPTFDVPENLTFDDLTLCVDTEGIEIPLAGLPEEETD